ncbi:FRAS1 protein [Ephemerocybe angulata]|uniref:FRAS1 protein n=1 Tax=Ephemerocybe angulata TaxID=980116 RepID=A0A8H6IFS5_9AGAR|nr:FRAS1 protein [Tulosesus angulatus]
MIVSIPTLLSVAGLVASTVAQSTPAVVCVAGQCVQGFTNTTIGAKLSAPGSSTSLHLLPGQYTSTTSPQLLHDLLTSSSASLASSAGLPSTLSLPLNLALQPGLAIYSESFYSGKDAFTNLPTAPVGNVTLPMAVKSLALPENVWVAVSSNTNGGRVVLWESVPDVSQVSLTPSLALLDIQSTSCSPACSGAGVCSAAGQCICPAGFGGSSCESCAPGFFGPKCQPCPSGCDKCDEGTSGSGRCLSTQVGDTDPRKCNCVNGVCGAGGSCTCSTGWVDKSDGTKCSGCAVGFFLTTTGDCGVCALGCSQCSDSTGSCNSCLPGYTQNLNDRTKCDPIKPVLSTGILCPDNTFSDGAECKVCSTACGSCKGPGDGDCLTCGTGLFMSGGKCVQADSNGVCEGSSGLVADNVKKSCETCPAKCTKCGIPNFTAGSTIDKLQCSQCLPGFVLANGKCVDTCPAGSFVDPRDNLTCIACSSSCGTCAGSADFCLTCPGNLLAADGKCVSTCPTTSFTSTSNTVPPANACLTCHPDCATCSGPAFNQCTSCSATRPVLSAVTGATAGRCLPTCSKNQFFDATSRTCQSCDSSCASCSGAGPSKCLSCSSSRQIVRGGQCLDATCTGSTGVLPGLGVCLSDLVSVPKETALPPITGLDNPTVVKSKLQWWQILLMVLGCVFIFVAFLWCCRRRARKQRAKKTTQFAKGKGIDKGKWKWGSFAAGWRMLFNRKKKGGAGLQEGELPIAYNHHEVTSRSRPVSIVRGEDIKMAAIPTRKAAPKLDGSAASEARSNRRKTRDDDLDSYIDAYDYSRRSLSIRSHTPSTLPDLDGYRSKKNNIYDRDRLRREVTDEQMRRGRERDLEQDSMYSEITGQQRHTPEPRMPVRRDAVPIGFQSASSSRSASPVRNAGKLRKVQKQPSDETMSSIVIQPQQRDAVLIDLGDNSNKQLPQAPLQYQTSPFLSSQPVQTPGQRGLGLTAAQSYAMTMAPDLIGGGPQANIVPGGAPMVSLPAGLGFGVNGAAPLVSGGIGTTGGLYWLQPTGTSDSGSTNFVLKPAMTGSSTLTAQTTGTSSKNPFRV